MKRMLRIAATTAFLLGLSGCNYVVSMEPWFTSADTRGAPRLRQGLWVGIGDDSCRVDLDKPADRWPECANAIFVRGDEWLSIEWDDPDGPGGKRRVFDRWSSQPVLIAAGDPLIFQVEAGPDPAADPDDPDTIVIDDGEPDWRYLYAAMRPTEVDGLGRVVAFEQWLVACGPPPEDDAGDHPGDEGASLTSGYVTDQPFPGLTVVGNNCTAESADAVRRAAALGRGFAGLRTMRWVRVGWR